MNDETAAAPSAAAHDDAGFARLFRRVVIGLAVVGFGSIFCVCGGAATWRSRIRRAADETLAELDRDGVGPRWEELLPPETDRNPADTLAPALAFARALTDPEREAIDGVYGDALGEGAFDYYGDPVPPEELPRLRALVDDVLARFAAADTIDASIDDGAPARFDYGSLGLDADLEHAMALRALHDLLGVRAMAAARDGRLDDAWRDVERSLRLAELHDDPFTLCRLVGIATNRRILDVLETLITFGPPEPARRERLVAALERLERPDGAQRAFRAELAAALAVFDGLMANDPDAMKELGVEGIPGVFEPVLQRDRAAYVDHMARLIRATGGGEVGALDEVAAIEASAAQLDEYHFVTRIMMPALRHILEKDIADRATLRLVRGALIAVGRGADGALPERPALPEDPFRADGGPLRWERLGPDRARLWSVGRDLADDGSAPPDPDAIDPRPEDIVLEVRLPRR